MTEVSAMPNGATNVRPNGPLQYNEKPSTTESGEAKANGDIRTPQKSRSKLPGPSTKAPLSLPTDSPLKSPGTPKAKSLPKTPENPAPPTPTNKKLPMNKIQVGSAPSPNLRAAQSKVGSLVNTTHKPGGGNVRIESHKIDFSKTQSRIEAKNDQYVRSGGDKKIPQVKLQWEAKSKIGSLENTTYKPGGGDKKIESVKLDFKEKAKSKVGSKDNVKHVPGGGTVKIQSQKLEFKAQSKVGSLDNVKHKPGGGDVKIFDDKTYLRQISASNSEGGVSGTQSYGDFSIIKDAERRSVPGTPGRRHRIQIKKTTIVSSEGSTPLTENNQNFMSTVKTPIREMTTDNRKIKQEIKVTYLTTEPEENLFSVNENARILKTSLSRSEENEGNGINQPKGHHSEGKCISFSPLRSKKEFKNFSNSNEKAFVHDSEPFRVRETNDLRMANNNPSRVQENIPFFNSGNSFQISSQGLTQNENSYKPKMNPKEKSLHVETSQQFYHPQEEAFSSSSQHDRIFNPQF